MGRNQAGRNGQVELPDDLGRVRRQRSDDGEIKRNELDADPARKTANARARGNKPRRGGARAAERAEPAQCDHGRGDRQRPEAQGCTAPKARAPQTMEANRIAVPTPKAAFDTFTRVRGAMRVAAALRSDARPGPTLRGLRAESGYQRAPFRNRDRLVEPLLEETAAVPSQRGGRLQRSTLSCSIALTRPAVSSAGTHGSRTRGRPPSSSDLSSSGAPRKMTGRPAAIAL